MSDVKSKLECLGDQVTLLSVLSGSLTDHGQKLLCNMVHDELVAVYECFSFYVESNNFDELIADLKGEG